MLIIIAKEGFNLAKVKELIKNASTPEPNKESQKEDQPQHSPESSIPSVEKDDDIDDNKIEQINAENDEAVDQDVSDDEPPTFTHGGRRGNNRKPCFKEHRPFQCSMCDYRAASRTNLIGHERTHTGERPFHCGQCTFRATLKSDLIKHMRRHTDERPHQCEHCPYRTVDKASLRVHLRIHTEEKPYACDQCQFQCTRSATMLHHRASHFKMGVKKYVCTYCGFQGSSKAGMASHLKMHDLPRRECSICKALVSEDSYKLHLENHKKIEKFTCEICQFKTKHEHIYVNHVVKHQRATKGKYFCKKCDFASDDPLKLASHQNTHEGESLYQCMSCAYSTTRRIHFTRHMMIHNGEKPWQCPYCEQCFRERALLSNHIIGKHPEAERFACPVPGCHYQTAFESMLPSHISRHEARDEQCPECNHTFRRKADLKQHMKIHGANKSLKCPLCSFSTSSKAALTRHSKDHALSAPASTSQQTATIIHCKAVTSESLKR